MPKPTLAQRLALGLASYGFCEWPSPSRKYRKFVKVKRAGSFGTTIYWLGPSGALRYGPTVTASYSVTSGRNYQKLLTAGDQRLAPPAKSILTAEQL